MTEPKLAPHSPSFNEVVALLSNSARLLVASDFDGTISKFNVDYNAADLEPNARVALRKLSELPNTFVAVISGRSLADLTSKCDQLERVRLVGSHGHEFDLDRVIALSDEQRTLLAKAENLVEKAVTNCPGSKIEIKPHGVVFHYRALSQTPTNEIDRLTSDLQALKVGKVHFGKRALEYCLVETNKGEALARIHERTTPTITVFIGDDEADEEVFKTLGSDDISIKVGTDESEAKFRLDSTVDAVSFLVALAEARAEWLRSLPASPIERHLFLSDLRTFALVDQTGTLSWLCAPRLDSPPLFGALVGGPGAGYFRISAGNEGTQEYVGGSLIGRTNFGNVSVTDFLDCGFDRTFQRSGRSDLVRLIEGRGEVTAEFAPKFDFGRVPTRLSGIENGLRIDCGQQRLILSSPGWTWNIMRHGTHDVARSTRMFNEECVSLRLLIGTASAVLPVRTPGHMLADTQAFWERWSSKLRLPESNPELVARSALVIRGLSYGPTGAIAAAATTSLPETLGGGRNWDYRYCWPRDASLAASSLLRLNAPGAAMKLLDWILGVIFDVDEDRFLAPLYTVTARSVPGEAEIPEALGYRASRPVRIGNLASEQLQLDTLGPIAELMWKLAQIGASLTSEHLQLAERLVGLVALRWRDADSGIWEVRGAQRHFVHSKLMCWYTVDCCTKVARYLGIEHDDWIELAQEIRIQIETEGYCNERKSYVVAYDLKEPDAALLWIILTRFHPADHPRCRGTLKYIVENLVHDGNVYRYHFNDALRGQEEEFIICRSWLIEALVIIGEREQAQKLFDQLLSTMKPLGLLPEQWDYKTNTALGNFPQAYSHLGFINAACALSPGHDACFSD